MVIGREVIYNLFPKFHFRQEGFSFYCPRGSDGGPDTELIYNFCWPYDNCDIFFLFNDSCECGRMLPSVVSGKCTNYDCLSNDMLDLSDGNIFYNLRVDLSDHTGSLSNCKLSAEVAASMLQCKV